MRVKIARLYVDRGADFGPHWLLNGTFNVNRKHFESYLNSTKARKKVAAVGSLRV